MSEIPLDKIGKRVGNIADLPEELKSQLQITKADELERQIIDVLSSSLEGVGNLDEILVSLYRKFKVIQERGYISNKLYRMTKAGRIKSVRGKRGVYQIF